jgi:hypothetical protein
MSELSHMLLLQNLLGKSYALATRHLPKKSGVTQVADVHVLGLD